MQFIESREAAGKKRKRVSKKKKSSWRKHSCVGEVDEYLEGKRQQDRVGDITEENVGDLFDDDKRQPVRSLRNRRIDLLDSHKSSISNSGATRQTKRIIDPSKVVTLTRKDLKKPRYKGGSREDGEKDEDEDEGIKKRIKDPYNVWNIKDDVDELELYRRRICRTHPVKPPNRQKTPTTPAIVAPHPGQSYNPSFHHHQSLLKEAVDREIVKGKREKKIINATDAMFPSRKDAPTQESWLNEMSEGLGGMVKIIGDNKELKGAEKKMVRKKKMMMKEEVDNDDGDEEEEKEDDEEKEKEDDASKIDDDEMVGDDDDKNGEEKDNDAKSDDDDGGDDDDDDDDDDGDEAKKMQLSNNAPVRREDKKSERVRRKMGERVKEEGRRLREKKLKKEMTQAFRVKSLRRQLQRQELQRAARLQHRLLQREKMATAPKKLGKSRFEEPAPVLKLTEEIKGDLRRLKPESHPMKELVHSLQRRNITPTTPRGTAIKPRKYKPKVFERKSHKAIRRDE